MRQSPRRLSATRQVGTGTAVRAHIGVSAQSEYHAARMTRLVSFQSPGSSSALEQRVEVGISWLWWLGNACLNLSD